MAKVILGGGLGGLSAAHYLLNNNLNQKIILVESACRTGGWIRSIPQPNGVIFEQGPRTIRPRPAPQALNTLKLIEDLGIIDKVYPILSNHPAVLYRLVYAKGKLNLLPNSIKSVFQLRPPLTKPMIFYLLRDLWAKPKKLDDDTIYNFIDRRFGKEIADYLISPLICGICAGNAQEISVKFLMKNFFEYEQKYGSIAKGIFKNLNKKQQSIDSAFIKRVKDENWSIYSFKDGCETLPIALTENIKKRGVDIKLNTNVTNIKFNSNHLSIHLKDNETIETEHLISSISAKNLAPLIVNHHPQLAELLNKIKYVNVAIVNLCYEGQLIENPAFGFLVAPKEKLPILGVIYDSVAFPRGNNTVLTVMMGGYWFDHYFDKNISEKSIVNIALEYLEKILFIKDTPNLVHVNILRDCIAQYIVGHFENIEKIRSYIKDKQVPLSLCGSSYYGVGINDVITLSKRVVEELSVKKL